MTMADRIVVMNKGLVEQEGRPLELYDFPANLFVAGFLGSPAMNMVEGRIDRADRSRFVTADGQSLHLAGPVEAPEGRDLVLGIRPEHISLTGPQAESATDAEVVVVEPTGAETLLTARLGKVDFVVAVRDRMEAAMGQKVWLGFAPGRLHFFDAVSGQRI
jgi:multiple sugar transport system ATP-binding protein